MLDQALEPNERMTFILSSMQSLSIIDSSDTRACSSSHFLQTMMNRSVLLLEIMNGKYFEVQDLFTSAICKEVTLLFKVLALADRSETWCMY